ncbi:S66 peptidase family protein [Pedobacter heparinus]|uniref:Peptidase U61 LD-carboxypeptidase A n=1 Tax=Pedobacter heparinus (strain ATCC 13125 / DSM 2366 / CIP 104194 / JCM 7457 / NBRC 12017 / NCIMB 9290 / NRRL B-14731 / HIM 762-3) TaxID=485917 RepID=C6XXY6_PEDHD|nr:LD-carboxypeptidase [Pedobacter heparinus]ACU04404.1 peptidase U61 LD-carboxypeptidase A [Pedobacter heparinus DSM 2366]
MNRKHFLSFLATAGVTMTTFKAWAKPAELAKEIKIPPYLQPGDTIGITSPAGYITTEQVQPAVQLMESWGFKVQIGNTIGKRDFSLGGTDDERTADLQQMLDDPNVKAIMCARGGYGAVRIIDRINFSRFKQQPKWVIGFSDITVFHCHLNRKLNIASIHSKMCNSFPSDWSLAEPVQIETILSIRQVLSGQDVKYTAPPVSGNRNGRAEGSLIGGNLSIIETLAGSASDINTDGKILFVEDTGEYLYSIDRMFWNLKRSGKLDKLKGLIVGGFKIKPEDPGDEFGRTAYEIVSEKIKEYDYPVCFDFPVGHQKNNFALKCGTKHLLNVDANGSSLVSI